MRCAWKELLQILPPQLRPQVDRLGKDSLQELRLRLGMQPELIRQNGSCLLLHRITREDLNFCINTASQYSPWAAETISQGYLTAPGGHRIGLCGEAVVHSGQITGIRSLSSLCIRVARDLEDVAEKAAMLPGNLLIIGSPGTGKTTLLRDLVRQISNREPGSVCVIDQREELFPVTDTGVCFPGGMRTDILTGCGKKEGMEMALRTMGPAVIALDEITAEEDCMALLEAGWCGVRLLATAHAASFEDLRRRKAYRMLLEAGLFSSVLVMQKDKSWKLEEVSA